MLKGKWKVLVCILAIACIFFIAGDGVIAKINEEYYNTNFADKEVVDSNLNEKVANSTLLDMIGSFIYAVGSLLEYVLGKVFQLLTSSTGGTGGAFFPWADAILFNAVPFLDVNVFTSSAGSLVSIMHDFITGMYYSLLTMATAFFGIAVLVTAIKLAITAIAEDKARYKKAIVDWIMGLVMLYGIHFFMSFVLYLNEQLVIVASEISQEEIADASAEIQALSDTSEYNNNIIYNFVNHMSDGSTTLLDVLITVGAIIIAVVVVVIAWKYIAAFKGALAVIKAATGIAKFTGWVKLIGTGLLNLAAITGLNYGKAEILKEYCKGVVVISGEYEEGRKTAINNTYTPAFKNDDQTKGAVQLLYKSNITSEFVTYDENKNEVKVKYTYNRSDVAAALLKNEWYITEYGIPGQTAGDKEFWTFKKGVSRSKGAEYIATLYYDTMALTSNCTDKIEMSNGEFLDTKAFCVGYVDEETYETEYIPPYDFYKSVVAAYESLPVSERTSENYDADLYEKAKLFVNIFEQYVKKDKSETNILSNLASYFKETAWETSETGWKATRSVIQNAIMYVLLVAYSLIFFISYTKRLFYVIMLILMAPIVVVMDFFMRFGK